ncbi:MAG: hypothetical protein A2289_13370 [Deltaproteobacteria bacterium RIFOXYA12_FULL_58_15]|nr:MAG: hypothetical protein A2289_13370 [Deltaproteobacteria bacterium RIFOXYA12_FULL_58_15]
MLDPESRNEIVSSVAYGEHPLVLSLCGCDADNPLGQLAIEIRESCGAKVTVVAGDAGLCRAAPALGLSRRGAPQLLWSFVPESGYVRPFVRGVELLTCGEPTTQLNEDHEALAAPVKVEVLTAAGCPHCPQAVMSAIRVAVAHSAVRTEVIDIGIHKDIAERLGVRSVPLTVVDGGLSIVGIPTAEELAKHIAGRLRPDFNNEVFVSLMSSGRLSAAVALLRDKGAEPLVTAWQGSTTADRMGLLLIAERVLEINPRALDSAVVELMALVDSGDAALRGDTVDLLGQIGDPRARPAIERLLADPNPDVAEIAKEVLEELVH